MSSTHRPWHQHLPESLRNYTITEDMLKDNAADILDETAENFQDAPAFTVVLPVGIHHTLSFKQINQCVDAFARYLQHHLKLEKGDVVGIQVPNSLHYPIVTFACWKIGVIITNINPLYTPRELEYQLSDSGAKTLIISDLFIPTLEKVLQTHPKHQSLNIVTTSFSDFFEEPFNHLIASKSLEDADAQGRSLKPSIPFMTFQEALNLGKTLEKYQPINHPIALYQYTGGTTGRSKGAIISHKNILSVSKLSGDNLKAYRSGYDQNDTVLTAIPFYHIFAFCVNFLMFFEAGVHNVLIPSPRPIANLKPAFEKFKITWLTGVDTLYASLLESDWFLANLPPLTCCISGGTALRPTTAENWRKKVGLIIEGYGMTECTAAGMVHPPIDQNFHAGSVGFPIPGTDVKVIDADGNQVPYGTRGEICIKGINVVQGYLNRDAETAETFVDGWLHTGDIAIIEEDGFCYIVDRKKDMILVSGFNVFPNEIEAVIAEFPEITEVAVIGIEDKQTGEAVKAFIATSNPNLDINDVIKYCKDNLTAYKVPKIIEILPELPKSTVGKILRAELRNLEQQKQSA